MSISKNEKNKTKKDLNDKKREGKINANSKREKRTVNN